MLADTLDVIADTTALTAILPILLFIFYYGSKPWENPDGTRKKLFGRIPLRRYSPLWRTNELGRTLMYKELMWVLLLSLIMANLIFDEWFLKEGVRVVVYGAMVFMFWRLFYTLRRVQLKRVSKGGTSRSQQEEESDLQHDQGR